MNFKRGIFGFVAALFSLSTISAQSLPAPIIASYELTTVLSNIFNGSAFGGDDLVARIIIFLLLTLVLIKPAQKVLNDKKYGTLVALLVALMGTRYLTTEMVQGLFLPTQALGITLSILIPFLLFEALMLGLSEDFPKVFRSIGYYLMAGLFLAMWWIRWTDIGDLAYYYLIGSALSFMGLWFDRSFRLWMAQNRIGSSRKNIALIKSIEIEEKLGNAMEAYVSATAKSNDEAAAAAKADMKKYEKALSELNKLF